MGLGRSSVLRIGSNPTKVSGSGQTGGESDSLAVVVHRSAPGEPHFPLGKGKGKGRGKDKGRGKGKISEIRYSSGSEYLRAFI